MSKVRLHKEQLVVGLVELHRQGYEIKVTPSQFEEGTEVLNISYEKTTKEEGFL